MRDSFRNWRLPVFDKDGWTRYGWRCQNFEKLKLGRYVDIGCFTYLNAEYGIEIGDYTQIGSHCSIYSVNTENDTKGSVFIGKNVLVGSNSLILPNAFIPSDSKIRAYSIIKEGRYVKREI